MSNQKTNKQKTQTGLETKDTKIGKDKETNRNMDQYITEETYWISTENELRKKQVGSNEKPKWNEKGQSDPSQIFRPMRTLSRSPVRISQDIAMTDVDLTGDEEENVFIEEENSNKGQPEIERESEGIGGSRQKSKLGGVDTTLMGIEQILRMLKVQNDIVLNYLERVKNANPTALKSSREMSKDLNNARDLIMIAAQVYREEKDKQAERERVEDDKTKWIMENMNNINKRIEKLGERDEKINNIQKRKNITPPELESRTKKTRVQNKEGRALPTIKRVEIIRNGEGASSDSEWETIKTKRRKEENKDRRKSTNTGDEEKKYKQRTMTSVKKNEAITISVNKERTYADVTKELRQGMGADVKGVKRIRQTRTGDILVEFENQTDSTEFHEKAKAVMGDRAAIRRLKPKATIEIQDIDPAVDKLELLESIAREGKVKVEDLICKNLRRAYMGTQAAIVEGPGELMSNIKDNKVKIGWVYCRVRQLPTVMRCFKCHNLGHVAARCAVVPEGTTICRRCGGNGHTMSECKSEKARCIICAAKGGKETELNHIAGSLKCALYKEAVVGKSRKQ
ncbi:golgin subfamily A member 6-like protein 22 [Osmia bicornis bicornis]|uniref:golgin subfamily A member 6-like protein 22 n=1 Tax=Osmia bicornis bicornis TaxID=1437191 RepID=UPI001EAE9EFB|nr:golgin subfamily A member 6-like protein 22 [Osmia bicornis bicornis]